MNKLVDTIAAIASGHINQAISIIRIVGPDALDIIKKIFTGKIGPNKTIQYGFIKDKDQKIDEVLVSFFIGSDNFVGEDTVEINSHGGIVVTQKILDLILTHGARLATKGEFTRRSYLNGKISLIKAEAINSLINAKTSKQHRIAINSFDLEREKKIQDFLNSLEYLIGLCEINIDYPEYDDVPILENKKFIEKIDELVEQLNKITKHSEANKIFVSQLNVAIVGEPNAGKSSLINAMLNEDKSIVTNIPGTTRDVVEAEIVFNDLVLKFKDTAGIRESNDEIEKIGIDKSWKQIETSDIIIHVIDSTKGISGFDQKIIEKSKDKKYIQLWNKSDLIDKKEKDKLYISSLNKDISSLENCLSNLFIFDEIESSTLVFNPRQNYCLKKSLLYLESVQKSIKEFNHTYDVLIVDLHLAWESLKEILGNVDKEDLLDSIFKNFCLGK